MPLAFAAVAAALMTPGSTVPGSTAEVLAPMRRGISPVCSSRSLAWSLVIQSMYAAATSGCFDPEVIARGKPAPPVETGGAPALIGGIRKNPKFRLRAPRCDTIQLPVLLERPL